MEKQINKQTEKVPDYPMAIISIALGVVLAMVIMLVDHII